MSNDKMPSSEEIKLPRKVFVLHLIQYRESPTRSAPCPLLKSEHISKVVKAEKPAHREGLNS